MSKHWKPDETVVQPLPRAKRLKSLDEFTLPDFVGRMDRVRWARAFAWRAMLVGATVAGAMLGLLLF